MRCSPSAGSRSFRVLRTEALMPLPMIDAPKSAEPTEDNAAVRRISAIPSRSGGGPPHRSRYRDTARRLARSRSRVPARFPDTRSPGAFASRTPSPGRRACRAPCSTSPRSARRAAARRLAVRAAPGAGSRSRSTDSRDPRGIARPRPLPRVDGCSPRGVAHGSCVRPSRST